METITVDIRGCAYPVYIGAEILNELGSRLRSVFGATRTTVISNPTIWNLYGEVVDSAFSDAGIGFDLAEVPDGEQYKTLEAAGALFESLVEFGAARNEPIVAFGGGVIGDLAGFVAATYMRGVPFVQVPTTLLAQVDSSVGGKVAVDLDAGKNLVGAFYQPWFVLADTSVLTTLPERQFRQGLAEAIKSALLAAGPLLDLVGRHMQDILGKNAPTLADLVKGAVAFKGRVVETDECDTGGVRAVLNYGHTVGHALEVVGSYRECLHGEAVSVGMTAASRLSRRLGLLDDKTARRQQKLLKQAGLPVDLPDWASTDDIMDALTADKKRTGESLNFVLLEGIGHAKVAAVEPEMVREVLEEMRHG